MRLSCYKGLEDMARRRMGPRRSSTIAVDLNSVSQELRAMVVEEGIEILGELAERIAEEANRNAPTLKNWYQTSDWQQVHYDSNPVEKQGPIKGHIFAMLSPKVPATWLVVSPAWYSHMVEYGTTPHELKPKRKGAMSFFTDDGTPVIRAGTIQHPGTKKQPFLRPAADKADQFLIEILKRRYGV